MDNILIIFIVLVLLLFLVIGFRIYTIIRNKKQIRKIINDGQRLISVSAKLNFKDSKSYGDPYGASDIFGIYYIECTVNESIRKSSDIWLKVEYFTRLVKQGRIKHRGKKSDCKLDIIYNKEMDRAVYYYPQVAFEKGKRKSKKQQSQENSNRQEKLAQAYWLEIQGQLLGLDKEAQINMLEKAIDDLFAKMDIEEDGDEFDKLDTIMTKLSHELIILQSLA